MVRGQRITELLSRLTWPVQAERSFSRFPRPFVAMGTDIETGEAVVLDGGIKRNLPAREARRLGADILICSNVADPLWAATSLESLFDVLLQTMSIYIDANSEPDRLVCDVLIRPDGRGKSPMSFDEATAWIARGAAAATAKLDTLPQVIDASRAAAGTQQPRDLGRPVRVTGVEIVGISFAIEEYSRRRLHLPVPATVGPDTLEAAVQRLYATELFERVTYRLDARGPDTVVVVTAEPRDQDHLGIGVRYDDAYDAALLFSVRLRNRLGVGSTTQFDLRLGEQVRVTAEHVSVGIGGTRLALGASTAYNYTPMHVYVAGDRLGEATLNVTSATLLGSLLLGSNAVAGIELKGEHADARTIVSGVKETRQRTYATGAVVVRANTLDRASFPSSGHMLSLRSEYVVGPSPFAHNVGQLLSTLPVGSRVSLIGRATVGASFPESAVPLHYTFMMGGAYPSLLYPETQVSFVGLRPQERPGTTVARFSGAVQWEPRTRVFATLRADAGRVGPRLTSDPDEYTVGIGAGIGALTPAGPVEAYTALRPRGGRPLLQLSLGYPF